MDWTLGGIYIKSSRLVYAPHLVRTVWLILFKYRGGDNVHWIYKNKMAETMVQWVLCGTNSVKISRICEFRVIMGIMAGLLGCCSSSTLGSRANDYVNTLATLGFWLHRSPCSLGCWRNDTLAARSLSPKQCCWDLTKRNVICLWVLQSAVMHNTVFSMCSQMRK